MIDILREIGMIDRALDSIANIEFKTNRFSTWSIPICCSYL